MIRTNNIQIARTDVVLNANGGFIRATVKEAATIRASEAHASKREREARTAYFVRKVGADLVDGGRPSPGAPLLLTREEAQSLASDLNGSRKRNRMAGGRNRRSRRRA